MTPRKTIRGYSLLEMLIYVAIVSLVATIIIQSFVPLARSYSALVLAARLNTSGSAALERMVREIRQASDVSVSSTLGSSPGTLVLDTTDVNDAATTMTFSLSGGRVMLQEGAASAYPLTSSKVTANRLVFYSVQNATTSKIVSVELTLSATQGSTTRTLPLRASALLRNN